MVQSKDSGGGSFSFIRPSSLCAVKRLRVVQSAHDGERGGELKPRYVQEKEQYVRETGPGSPSMHLYTFVLRERMYSHLYRGVGLRLLPQEQGTSCSTVNWLLLALMHTWQVHVCLCTLKHTVHTLLGAQRGWVDARQCRLWQIQWRKTSGNEPWPLEESRSFHKISNWTNVCLDLDMNSPGRKSSLESFGAATSFCFFYSLAHPCCAKIGLLIKPLADMNKTYQIHLFTYKDFVLFDWQGRASDGYLHAPPKLWSHTHAHTLAPLPKKRGKESSHAPHTNIYKFANIKFLLKNELQILTGNKKL